MFICSPDHSSRARGKTFPVAEDAIRWAQKASARSGVGYTIWARKDGRFRRFKTLYPSNRRGA
jgi:hypothetical protein